MMQTQSQIKLNHRGLIELALACAFLALLSFAVWSWQLDGEYVTALGSTAPEQQNALLSQVIRNPVIKLASVTAEFVLLLAVTLALVPPTWWLQSPNTLGKESTTITTSLRWLGHVIKSSRSQPEVGNDPIAVNAAGEPIYYYDNRSGVAVTPFNLQPGQLQPGQLQPGQLQPGQLQPGQLQPGQLQPGQLQPGQLQPGQLQPGQLQPGQLQPGQLQPGQLQPGQLQPGQLQPGQLQPGQLQPGQLQPGQLQPAARASIICCHPSATHGGIKFHG